MGTSYGAGNQGTLDSIKERLDNAKKLGSTSVSSYEVSVEETQSKGIAIITPDDVSAESAIGSYKETVVEQMDSKVGNTAGGILNAVTAPGKDTLNRIQNDDASVVDDLFSKVDQYKNAPKGYQTAILDDVANNVNNADLGMEGTYSATLKELGTRNFGSGSGGFKNNLVENINSAFKLATGDNSTKLLLSNGSGENPVSLQLSSLLLKGGGDKLLNVVSDYTGFSLSNVAQKNAIVSTLLGKVIDLGVKELIDPLINKLLFGAERDEALLWNASGAISGGDIRTLNKIIEALSDDQARKNLYRTYPMAVADILRAFRFRYEDKEKDYPYLKSLMLDIFVKFGGTNWMYHPDYLTERYVNLTYTSVSPDAITLLMDIPEVAPIIQCNNLFAIIPAKMVFLRDFSNVPIVDY